jgi:uncharacterized protein (DUF433 family)
MLTQTASRYVVRNPDLLSGEPVIAGTKTPIRAIVELWRLGNAPEEITQHLPYLSLAQIFDALSFYLDHQEEIQGYIESNRIPDHKIHPAVRALLEK